MFCLLLPSGYRERAWRCGPFGTSRGCSWQWRRWGGGRGLRESFRHSPGPRSGPRVSGKRPSRPQRWRHRSVWFILEVILFCCVINIIFSVKISCVGMWGSPDAVCNCMSHLRRTDSCYFCTNPSHTQPLKDIIYHSSRSAKRSSTVLFEHQWPSSMYF